MDERIDAWFAAAGPREDDLRRLDALVVGAAPELAADRQLVPTGSTSVLGYGLMPYRPRSAEETTLWPLISLAAQKRHLSLYVCAVAADGRHLAEAHADRLGRVSCGRSCVRFTALERVDAAALAALVREAADLTATGGNAYSAG